MGGLLSSTKPSDLMSQEYDVSKYMRMYFNERPYTPDTGGPIGLGDPKDRSLNGYELDPLIPQRMRHTIKYHTCKDEEKAYDDCYDKHGYMGIINCRDAQDSSKSCVDRWMSDMNFRLTIATEYLDERSHYRQTGIKTMRYMRGSWVERDESKSPWKDPQTGGYTPRTPMGWEEAYKDGPPDWAGTKPTGT